VLIGRWGGGVRIYFFSRAMFFASVYNIVITYYYYLLTRLCQEEEGLHGPDIW